MFNKKTCFVLFLSIATQISACWPVLDDPGDCTQEQSIHEQPNTQVSWAQSGPCCPAWNNSPDCFGFTHYPTQRQTAQENKKLEAEVVAQRAKVLALRERLTRAERENEDLEKLCVQMDMITKKIRNDGDKYSQQELVTLGQQLSNIHEVIQQELRKKTPE